MEKLKVIEIVFTVAVVLSVVLLIGPMSNYMKFYTAIEKISLEVPYFSFSIEEDEVIIAANFSVTNPTGYTGLGVKQVAYEIYFKSTSGFTALTGGHTWFGDPAPLLNPYSNITCEISVSSSLDEEPAKSLANLSTEKNIEFDIILVITIKIP